MAETRTTQILKLQKWESQFFSEYMREGPFSQYMGAGLNNIIQVKSQQVATGQSIDFPYIYGSRSDGVTGSTPLEGNEEEGTQDSHRIYTTVRRKGYKLVEEQMELSQIDQMDAYREQALIWAKTKLRNDIIQALLSISLKVDPSTTGIVNHAVYTYGVTGATATTANMNSWCANNSGRILFGAAEGNYNATFLTGMGNVDTSADKMTFSVMDIAKLMIKKEDLNPHYSPVVGDKKFSSKETYVAFMHPIAFQHFRDSLIASGSGYALQQAEVRGKDNPLWTAGDLEWNGMLCHELQGLPTLAGGNGGTLTVPTFLCGAGAIGLAYAQKPKVITENTDYGERVGVGIRTRYGVDKLAYLNPATAQKVQHGVLTIFTSVGA